MEKPTTISSRDTKNLIYEAHQRGLFLGTNYWTRYLPIFVQALELESSGVIGPVKHIRGDLGFQAVTYKPDPWFDRFLRMPGGGILRDLGGYLLLYFLKFGHINSSQSNVSDPIRPNAYSNLAVKSFGTREFVNGTQIDVSSSFLLVNQATRLEAQFSLSLERDSPMEVQVIGTHGTMYFKNSAICPQNIEVTVFDDANSPGADIMPRPCCQQQLLKSEGF